MHVFIEYHSQDYDLINNRTFYKFLVPVLQSCNQVGSTEDNYKNLSCGLIYLPPVTKTLKCCNLNTAMPQLLFQDNKADVILKYNADEARSLKAYGELPEHGELR